MKGVLLDRPAAGEGYVRVGPDKYHSIFIPRHVMEMTKADRHFWMAERHIIPAIQGATSFSGFETLAAMGPIGAAVGPTASLLSILNRESVVPIAPAYHQYAAKRLRARAYGKIDTTATVPTYQLQLLIGPTFANPLTSGQLLAGNVAITPAASTNLDFWLDVSIHVVSMTNNALASFLAVGTLLNDWAASGTYVISKFLNAVPPTAVLLTGTGGQLVPLYYDLEIIMGAATAGNTITCYDYELVSMN